MKKYLENILSMFYTVISVLEDFQVVWTPVAVFVTYKGKLVAKVGEIELMKQETDKDITGFAKQKDKKMRAVTKLAMGISGALRAYAIDKVLDVLKEEISFVKSDFWQARDSDFITMCNLVLKRGNENAADLVDFGVTAPMLIALKTAIIEYTEMVQDPRSAIAERKSGKIAVEDLFTEGKQILDVIDGMMEQFVDTNKDFYNSYKAAREIVDAGIRHEKPAVPPDPPTP